MAPRKELGESVNTRASLLPRRLWRFLLAHDVSSRTCDSLIVAVERALGNVDILDVTSVDHALSELQTGSFDATFVCLDLPPAPLGGSRLAQAIVQQGGAVVLVTRSLRWLPNGAVTLQRLPWITPEASPADVAKAVKAAMADVEAQSIAVAPSSSGFRLRDETVALSSRR